MFWELNYWNSTRNNIYQSDTEAVSLSSVTIRLRHYFELKLAKNLQTHIKKKKKYKPYTCSTQ